MKIDIKNSTYTKGLVFKDTFYKLELNVELTEEEKAIIKQRKLEDTIIWKLPPPASFPQDDYDGFNLLIANLKGGYFWYDFKSPAEAKVFQEELIEKLKIAKQYLQNNTTTAQDTSLEI